MINSCKSIKLNDFFSMAVDFEIRCIPNVPSSKGDKVLWTCMALQNNGT